MRHFPMILDDRASASAAAPHPNVQFFVTYSPFIAVSVMLRETHDGGHHEKKKLTEADVTAESVLCSSGAGAENAGHQRDRAFLPPPRRPTCWTGLKATTARQRQRQGPEFAKPAEWQANLTLTPEDKVAGYNNFYEFGLDKADPAANAGSLRTDPDAHHRWRSGETSDP